MDFEGGQLRQVGGFGRRSRFLAAASGLPNAGLALGLAAGLLLAAVPPHRCRPDPALLPAALRNASSPELRNASAPPGSRCLLYRYPRPGGGSGPPNGTGPCTRGWQYVLPAAGLRSTLVTQWDLVCAKQWQVPLEQTTHLLGWLMGYAALGASCDRFGRRTIFVLSLVLSVPLGFGVALAVDYLMLVVLRMLFGAVLAGGFLSLYVARLELCDPPHRLTVTMSASFFWVAGQLILPGLAVAVAEWRLLQGAITLGLALLTACWWSPSLFPESARWLLATQQLQRGKRALLDLARGNGVWLENDSTTGEPFSAADWPARLPPHWAWDPVLLLCPETDSRAGGVRRAEYHSVCRIFSTRVVWKNSLILGFTAFIGSGIRHCFARNLAPYAPHFYFPYFLLAGSEAVAILFLCLTVDHFGRRALLLFGTILTGVSSLLLLALMQYLMAWLVLALSILGILASQAVATLSIFFASEVLPTVVRGAGLGLILAAHTLGQAVTPIMDIQHSRGFFLHHVVFASFAILSVLSVMLLPETSHRPLPDSMQEGESLHRPPLFHPTCRHCRHQDQLPLLSTHGGSSPYDPESYAHLVTATKKMLGSHGGGAGAGGQGSSLTPGT
ncbi:putative solute carrier family 22 member 31 isoform X3 [Crotalus tigris]|uniref:putative solute carrier family 22 member 31 isoform X3 n=1 Tax=Crotalus tigris TaxID=88082 RepID=UPI00192F90B6|nr:putative solute carrier family 22 member 31 isoform X3 [Crotalus tigris]